MNFLLKKVLGFFLGIIGIFTRLFRRAICRVKGHRRDSGTILPLANKHLEAVSSVQQSFPGNEEVEMQSWDNWGGEEQPLGVAVQDHHGNIAPATNHTSNNIISNSHHSSNRKSAEPEEEPDLDFFQDMAPSYKKPKKVLVKKRQDLNSGQSGNMSSRLAMHTVAPAASADLDEWQDDTNAWDEEDEDLSLEAEATIKEKRRLERERRQLEHQKRKLEKEAQRSRKTSDSLSAVRLS
ncbi:unnamed protein product [Owenia fusiformis]|uniref:Uncharacterized protein n=1 Tax=Owenia fusiformis TaxID=6347 RepID=A0A8J1XPW2_OWEFU|nr:unnamed protein product [Owenia fusiformis]